MKSCPGSYLHFENLDAPKIQNFTTEAHAETHTHFLDNDKAHVLSNRTSVQMQDTRQISFYQEHRVRVYHFHQDAEYPRGVYCMCVTTIYRSGYPEWKILFSVTDSSKLLDDDIYLGGMLHLVGQPDRTLLILSKSGGDTAYTLEVDLKASGLVEDSFRLPTGRNHVSWRDKNSVWMCPAWDERQLIEPGYPREVRPVEHGRSFEGSLLIYRIGEDGMMVNAWRHLDPQGSSIGLIGASDGFYIKTYLQVSLEGKTKPPSLLADCGVVGYLAGHPLLTLRGD